MHTRGDIGGRDGDGDGGGVAGDAGGGAVGDGGDGGGGGDGGSAGGAGGGGSGVAQAWNAHAMNTVGVGEREPYARTRTCRA